MLNKIDNDKKFYIHIQTQIREERERNEGSHKNHFSSYSKIKWSCREQVDIGEVKNFSRKWKLAMKTYEFTRNML